MRQQIQDRLLFVTTFMHLGTAIREAATGRQMQQVRHHAGNHR
jgi:hypothetical protein